MTPEERINTAIWMAEYYEDFVDFAKDALHFLNLEMSEMQEDVADFMANGPRLRMVQAGRGLGKSVFAAVYAVWCLVRDPTTVFLSVSAGGTQAAEVAHMVVDLIRQWPALHYLRPDNDPDDTSRAVSMKFDVHPLLKGVNKSPSVQCASVVGTLPGKRANVLLADDIESNMNSLTPEAREKLLKNSREFLRICKYGEILYLGTPQSKDSVYNTLPARGFEVRIWPSRYPTPEQLPHYDGMLSPWLRSRLEADPSLGKGGGINGLLGKPTDPVRLSEEELCDAELDNGPEDFQLQYMLDTRLADEARLQLKIHHLLVANFPPDYIPESLSYCLSKEYEYPLPGNFMVPQSKMYSAIPISGLKSVRPEDVLAFIDPAGGGGDEIAIAVGTAVGEHVHVLDCMGVVGGLTDQNLLLIRGFLARNRVTRLICEANMGHGSFEKALSASLVEDPQTKHLCNSIQSIYSKGQKERRIIDSMVSMLQRHRIVVHPQAIESDIKCCKVHPPTKAQNYSWFYQLANITTDRDCLVHDDRLEAVAGLVAALTPITELSMTREFERREQQEVLDWLRDPLGDGTYIDAFQMDMEGTDAYIEMEYG